MIVASNQDQDGLDITVLKVKNGVVLIMPNGKKTCTIVVLTLVHQEVVVVMLIHIIMELIMPVLVVSHPDLVGVAGLAIKAEPNLIVTQAMLNGERMSTTAVQDCALEHKVTLTTLLEPKLEDT